MNIVPDAYGHLAFERPELWPLALLLLVLTVLLVRRLYRLPDAGGERHLLALPTLRVLAVALLLSVLLGPVWHRPARPADAGPIAVLLDTSLSMGVVDSQRTPGEQLRLARALGIWTDPDEADRQALLGKLAELEAVAARTARFREQAELLDAARRDPRQARARLADSTARLAELIAAASGHALSPPPARELLAGIGLGAEAGSPAWADSARRTLSGVREEIGRDELRRAAERLKADPAARSAAEAVARWSRLDLARRLLTDPDHGLLARLPEDAEVELYAFDSTLRPVRLTGAATGYTSASANHAAPTANHAAPTADHTAPSPIHAGPATDHSGPTADHATGSPDRAGLAGLRAEGRGTDLASAVATVAARGRPPAALVLLTDGRSARASPPTSPPAQPPPAPPMPPAALPVFALAVAPDAPPPGVRVLALELPDSLVVGQAATAAVTIRAVGVQGVASLQLAVAGQTQVREVAVAAGQTLRLEFDLRAERPGGLLVELSLGQPAAAAPTPPLRIRRVLRVVPREAEVVLVARHHPWDARLLRSALLRTPWLSLTQSQPGPALPGLLRRADAVVLVDLAPADLDLASRAALADALQRRGRTALLLPGPVHLPGQWLTDPELAAYLPAESATWRASPAPDGSFIAAPTAPGGFLGPAPAWAQRRPLLRVLALSQMRPSAVALLAEGSTGLPLLTEHPVGAGRVLLLATDQAWRWHAPEAASPGFFAALLTRLLDPPFAASEAGVCLDAAPVPGSPYRFAVRVRKRTPEGSPAAGGPAPVLQVRRDGRTVLETTATEASPGRFVAALTLPDDAPHQLQLRGLDRPRLTLLAGDSGLAELADPSGDAATLAHLTQGRTYSPDAVAKLAEELTTLLRNQPGLVATRIWDSPLLLLAVLALLSAEWALRKHWGLA